MSKIVRFKKLVAKDNTLEMLIKIDGATRKSPEILTKMVELITLKQILELKDGDTLKDITFEILISCVETGKLVVEILGKEKDLEEDQLKNIKAIKEFIVEFEDIFKDELKNYKQKGE